MNIETMFEYRWFSEWHGWRRVLWFQFIVQLSRVDPLFAVTAFGFTVAYGPRLKPITLMPANPANAIKPCWADERVDIAQEIKKIKERFKL